MTDQDVSKPSLADRIKNPFQNLKETLENTHLRDAKIHLIHKKHQIGKLGNLFNAQHRHDEEHEIQCDNKRSKICESHRFESYFPERDGNAVKWYVDGRDYFWAVSEALDKARETIYIADWWLSPEVFMRRPPYFEAEWRLDRILKRRAEAGVQIYVIVYREVEAALACNSAHTKHALQALCPKGSPGHGNIHIMRHPDHNVFENGGDMTFYWAHHEKFVVVDYETAFVGGLDLCFGRWDNHTHQLSDMHPEGVVHEMWPGQDFNNNRIKDFQNVQDWKQNELSKAESGRMPWHDVAMGFVGPCVYDVAEHFVLRWNFIKRDKYKRDTRFDWLQLRGRQGDDEDLVGVQRPDHPMGEYLLHPLTPKPLLVETLESGSGDGDGDENGKTRPAQPVSVGTVRCQLVRSAADWSNGTLTEHSIQNAYSDLIRKAEHYVYIENQFFITATGADQAPVHNTIGAAIVDAVVAASKRGKTNFRVIIVLPAVPGFAGDLRDDAATGTRAIMDYQYKSICRGPHSIFERVRAQGVDPEKHIFLFNLRSYDRLPQTAAVKRMEEQSGVSYKELQRAQAEEVMGEGIYGTIDTHGGRDTHMGRARDQQRAKDKGSSDLKGKNQPSYQQHALDTKERFEAQRDSAGVAATETEGKAEIDGNGNDNGGDTAPQAGLQPQKSATTSITSKVAPSVSRHAMAVDGQDHGQGVSAEPWEGDAVDEVNNWIQEELYIHAKLLIVDDRYVVCGSSNLNDRSQLGTHDSELSVVMEDTRTLASRMDGEPFEAGYHAASLRRYLWREHLGLLPPQDEHDASNFANAQPPEPNDGSPNDAHNTSETDKAAWDFVEDPLGDELWKTWTNQASTNTEIFRHLFHADPDDHVKTFEQYDRYMPPKGVQPGHIFDQFIPPEDIRAKLDQVRGHLVWMPLHFLEDAAMAETGLQVNQWTESVYA